MIEIDDTLYRTSPAYRALADELRRVTSEAGAIGAAYQNALNDQQRAKGDLLGLVKEIEALAERYAVAGRDDPGRGGSGGSR